MTVIKDKDKSEHAVLCKVNTSTLKNIHTSCPKTSTDQLLVSKGYLVLLVNDHQPIIRYTQYLA